MAEGGLLSGNWAGGDRQSASCRSERVLPASVPCARDEYPQWGRRVLWNLALLWEVGQLKENWMGARPKSVDLEATPCSALCLSSLRVLPASGFLGKIKETRGLLFL